MTNEDDGLREVEKMMGIRPDEDLWGTITKYGSEFEFTFINDGGCEESQHFDSLPELFKFLEDYFG